MENVETFTIIVQTKNISGSWIFFLHSRFDLTSKYLFDHFIVALKLDNGEKMSIELFEILRMIVFPVIVVMLKLIKGIEDSSIEYEGSRCLITLRKTDFNPDIILCVKTAIYQGKDKLPFIVLFKRFTPGVTNIDIFEIRPLTGT